MYTTKNEITESGLSLMRIEVHNAVIFTSKNIEDFSKELSGIIQEFGLMRIADPSHCMVLCDRATSLSLKTWFCGNC